MLIFFQQRFHQTHYLLNYRISGYRIWIVCLLILAGLASFSQNPDIKISIEAHNQPLGEIIKQISEKGNILFSYNPELIPVTKKISLSEKNTALTEIFSKVFTANGIDYFISEKQVILKLHQAEPPSKPETVIPRIHNYTISGYIRDKANGEVIIGANVYDQLTFTGTTSNSYGFYSLSLPEGDYTITNSFVGYTTVKNTYKLNKNIEVQVELEVSPMVMSTIEISANPDKTIDLVSKSGEIRLPPSLLKQIPGFAGNVDVLKSLQNIPGIVTFGDGSSFYYVRGGNSDQNQLLIDEAPIYNPAHLFGFFSALAPDAIKDVRVYKGDYPSNYGGRLSSVVDVRAREGNMKKLGVAGNFGPYTSDLTLEGPILKDKSSFLVSGRISNLNWLQLSSDQQRSYKFNFYDFNAKFNIWLNKNNRIFLTAFKGNDVFERYNSVNSNIFGISWNNVAGTLRWNHVFSSKLFSNTSAFVSRYNYFLDIAKELKNYWTSSVSDITLKTDFSWYPNPKNTIRAGVEFKANKSNPGNLHYTDSEIQSKVPQIAQYQTMQLALYAGNEQQLTQKINLRYGFRISNWQNLGATSVYFFDGNHNVIDTLHVAKNTIYQRFVNFDPRVNLRYAINENAGIQMNYTHNTQHLQVLSNSTSPFTSLEVWVPSGPNIKPQKADQFSLGFYSKVLHHQLDFSIEGYYKRLYNQIDYKDHPNLLFNPLLEGELRFGDGWSYGIETLLRKSTGKFTGWICYAYSRAMKQIEDVNNGKIFPSAYDRPHNLCITVAYHAGQHWSFSSHWIYLTGSPFTSPTGFYYVNGYSVPVYGDKNNDRFPDYHRLDASVNFAINKPGKRFQHNLILTVYNVYGRHNPFEQSFNKIMDDNGIIVVPANLQGDVERIGTSISVAGAIPSLNYTFRF